MTRLTIACGSLVCAVVAGAMLSSSMRPRAAAVPAAPVTHTVTIDGTQFQPADVAIKPGDSVTWVNRDPFPHTATAGTGAFDSKEIAPGASWTFTAKARGDLAYTCTLHPTMKGIVHVQ
jgi:plastocyanin